MISKTGLTESYGPEYEGGVVSNAMTPRVLAVGPDDSVERAIHVMAFERIHRVLVVDTQGALVGIVTSMEHPTRARRISPSGSACRLIEARHGVRGLATRVHTLPAIAVLRWSFVAVAAGTLSLDDRLELRGDRRMKNEIKSRISANGAPVRAS